MISAKEFFFFSTPGIGFCPSKSEKPVDHGLMVNFFSIFNLIKICMDHLADAVFTENCPCDKL